MTAEKSCKIENLELTFATKEEILSNGYIFQNMPPINKLQSKYSIKKTSNKQKNPNICNESPHSLAKFPSETKGNDIFYLKETASSLFKLPKKVKFYQMPKLRNTITNELKKKGLMVSSPRKGVKFSKCPEIKSFFKRRKNDFLPQKNCWPFIEKHIFERNSFMKLLEIKKNLPMKRISYFKRSKISPLSAISQEINKEKLKSLDDPIQRSIERLRNYSPSPPNNRKTHNKKQISSYNKFPTPISLNKNQKTNGEDQKFNGRRLRKRRWLNSSSPSTKSNNNDQNIRASVSSQSVVGVDDNNNQLNNDFSRSRSRFSSKSQQDADYSPTHKKQRIKRGRWRNNNNTHIHNEKNNEEVINNSIIPKTNKRRGRQKKTQSFIKLSDLLAQFQKTHSQSGIFQNEQESSSGSVVSEKEMAMRRQINEDRIRKAIGKIDAPSYSIDQKIVYFKDLDNVMQREDIFDDLMGGFFAGSPQNQQDNQNLNEPPPENIDNKVIIVQEDNEIEKQPQPKKENMPAFKFIPKENEEKSEWLEKRWSLCKNPFKKNHFINSVSSEILDNLRNDKDINGIAKHFLHLKYM